MPLHPTLRLASWLLFVLLAGLAPDARGQQAETERHPTVHDLEDLVTSYFRPRHLDPNELESLVSRLRGRNLYVEQRGGLQGRPIENVLQLGDALIIHDTPEQVTAILELLEELDGKGAAETGSKARLVSAEWSPRHVSLDTAYSALGLYNRANTGQPNVTLLRERGVIVMRDTSESVDEMTRLLEAIDRPEPQLLLSCLVIRATSAHEDITDRAEPPADLVADLSRLVPFSAFVVDTTGVVRVSARAREIGLDMGPQQIELRPDAFDEEHSALSTHVQFKGRDGTGFETRTTILPGEYTVLGATGPVPVFAVLRLEPLGSTAASQRGSGAR